MSTLYLCRRQKSIRRIQNVQCATVDGGLGWVCSGFIPEPHLGCLGLFVLVVVGSVSPMIHASGFNHLNKWLRLFAGRSSHILLFPFSSPLHSPSRTNPVKLTLSLPLLTISPNCSRSSAPIPIHAHVYSAPHDNIRISQRVLQRGRELDSHNLPRRQDQSYRPTSWGGGGRGAGAPRPENDEGGVVLRRGTNRGARHDGVRGGGASAAVFVGSGETFPPCGMMRRL